MYQKGNKECKLEQCETHVEKSGNGNKIWFGGFFKTNIARKAKTFHFCLVSTPAAIEPHLCRIISVPRIIKIFELIEIFSAVNFVHYVSALLSALT